MPTLFLSLPTCRPTCRLVSRRPAARRAAAALALASALSFTAAPSTVRAQSALPLNTITLPPGFSIELLARVPNARQMALGPRAGGGHVLYVGSKGEGAVHALELDAAGKPGKLHQVARGLNEPVGVAFRDGHLYVSAVSRILRLERIGERLAQPPQPQVLRDDLPTDRSHGWKFIAFGPDGWLYVPVGAPCNICEPAPDRYASIMRMSADGAKLETFARGVRNTVGFDWHPETRELWFTENGRDMLGDDAPPDELNHAPKAGMHFGYPYCHAGVLPDPEYGVKRGIQGSTPGGTPGGTRGDVCKDFTAPAQLLGAHVAALGLRFYTGAMFPAEWRNRVFIAEHGSWNRSRKVGYRITTVKLDGARGVAYEPFASGWLQGESAWGRPADVLVAPDGALLVSDDAAGAIYRISHRASR
jgi:glucose/arabinose dehydrogenase